MVQQEYQHHSSLSETMKANVLTKGRILKRLDQDNNSNCTGLHVASVCLPLPSGWHPLLQTRQSTAEHKGQQAHLWSRGHCRQRSVRTSAWLHTCFLGIQGVWCLQPPAKSPVMNHCSYVSSCAPQKILLLHLRTEGNLQMSIMCGTRYCSLKCKGVHEAGKTKCEELTSRTKTQIKTPTKKHNAQMLLSVRRLSIVWLFNYMSECP